MSPVPLVLAHVLPPGTDGNALQGWNVLLQWQMANPLLLLPLAAALVYARGLRRWPERSTLRPWAPYSFYTGLALMVIALAGPLDALADDLFSMHMLQHMLLVMIGPPLIMLGAPTTPILKGLPTGVRRGVVAPLMRSRAARSFWHFVSHPATIILAFTINLWLWHFLGNAYVIATQRVWVHVGEHWLFVVTSLLLWWVVIDPKPLKSRLSYPLRILFIGVTMLQKVVLGAFITYRETVLYAYYAARPRMWGISPMNDQQLAAMIMWIGGTMVLMLALIAVMLVWFDQMEKRSRVTDALEDAASAAALQGGR